MSSDKSAPSGDTREAPGSDLSNEGTSRTLVRVGIPSVHTGVSGPTSPLTHSDLSLASVAAICEAEDAEEGGTRKGVSGKARRCWWDPSREPKGKK
jgi:hypothetical protein